MDIWEANEYATALTPHTCNQTGLYECTGTECSWSGVCDQWGCSYNPYPLCNLNYYRSKETVDTTKTMTIVTQFPTFPNGTLREIRRPYIQNGKVIQNVYVNGTGEPDVNNIDAEYCAPSASWFVPLRELREMGAALARGMVLIFSIWWDTGGYMNWLGTGSSGPCNATEGDPAVIEVIQPNPAVTFSKIKWGEIGSTYDCD
jgi:cellulase